MAEGLMLLQLAAREVIEAGQLQGLVQVFRRLAAAVQLLQIALPCKQRSSAPVAAQQRRGRRRRAQRR